MLDLSLTLLLACGSALLACGGGDDTGAEDTGSTPDETPAWCDTAVEVGWHDFGQGFLLTHCQGCHATTAPDRYGAPETVYFDTESDALERADAILRTVITDGTMPPAGGVTDDEKLLLEAWLSCSS